MYHKPNTMAMRRKVCRKAPGDSARSHTADEYILKSEIAGAVDVYVELLEGLEL